MTLNPTESLEFVEQTPAAVNISTLDKDYKVECKIILSACLEQKDCEVASQMAGVAQGGNSCIAC